MLSKEEIIKKHQYKLLDKGFLKLVDFLGSDESIENAARVSYAKGTREVSETKTLLRYLMRHRHTSPFEMAEVILHVKLPIFVARQWIRHRTASVNELSGRYSELLLDDCYTPKEFRTQSKENKQGSGKEKIDYEIQSYGKSYTEYNAMLNRGITREQARIVLPLSAYTEWIWKIDLHNLFHFLGLRLESHAQEEIRVYAEKIALIIKDLYPISWEAFEDYKLNAISFSNNELKVLKGFFDPKMIDRDPYNKGIFEDTCKVNDLSKRERKELQGKFKRMGIKL